jgi:zinc protease
MRKLLCLAALITAAAAAQTAAPAKARTSTLPSVDSLKFPPLREVKIPDITTFTLPNGMRVYLLANDELPLVSGSVTVRTGNLFDPPDKVGLAGITGTVIRSGGTKAKTGDEIDEALENIAASVESGIGETSGSVSFNALKENTDEVLAIFKDVLTSPAFRQDKLDLAKTQTKSAIARRNDDADGIASREFASIVYGRNNPFGWSMEYEHVDNIQRDDLVKFYDRYFFPSNLMLAVYGDFSVPEMRAKLEKLFADWNVKKDPVPPFPEVRQQEHAPGVYQATKTEVTQAFFEVGHLGGVLRDKDYPALSVMSDILGGGFSSRLFQNVRTNLGLAYSVGGGWGANYGHPGLFRIAGSTKSPSTVDALQAVKAEIEKIRTAEVTDQELETAKQSVLNSFVFYFDHPRKILSRYLVYEYWNYPKNFIFEYQKAVQAVTKADVMRVAKEHLHPERLAVVAVGDPKDFGKPLSALGEVKELDIRIPQPKTAVSKVDAGTLARGKALLQRAQQAVGGADKLAAVKDVMQVAEATMAAPGGQGAMKVKSTTYWIAPGILRQDNELPFGKMAAFWDGKEGWLSTPQGTAALPPPVVKQIQGEAFRRLYVLLLSDRDPERTVSAVNENTVEISNKSGDSVRLEFDPATGLPSKLFYQSPGMGGAPVQSTSTLSDFREVGGLRLPHKFVQEQGGQKSEGTVTEIKINSGLTAEQLSKKP